MNTTYNASFRCYFPSAEGPNYSTHYQRLALEDIPKWIEAYRFTHPTCESVSVKLWFFDNGISFRSVE